jgi:VanZ family protein
VHQIWLAVRANFGIGLLALVPLAAALVAGALLWRRVPAPWQGRVAAAGRGTVAAMALVVICAITLVPSGYPLHSLELVPFSDVRAAAGSGDALVRSLANCVGNAALFLPLGAALAAFRPRLRFGIAFAGCVATSVVIEIIQYATPVGRVADVTDVLMNATGAAIGWFAWCAVARLRGTMTHAVLT